MFESTLSIDLKKKRYLDYVYERLKPQIKAANSVVANAECKDRVFLSLACEDRYKDLLHFEIINCLADVYAMGFKYDYLKNRLKIRKENLLTKTLLNTMTVFDSNNDKKLIKQALFGQQIIAIDGFFSFRLHCVKDKWDEIIDLTNDNAIVFSDDEVTGEFLSFLLEAIPRSEDGVKICKLGEKIELFDKKGKKLRQIMPVGEEKTQEETVLFNLICLSPKKVLISDAEDFSHEFLAIVRKFF